MLIHRVNKKIQRLQRAVGASSAPDFWARSWVETTHTSLLACFTPQDVYFKTRNPLLAGLMSSHPEVSYREILRHKRARVELNESQKLFFKNFYEKAKWRDYMKEFPILLADPFNESFVGVITPIRSLRDLRRRCMAVLSSGQAWKTRIVAPLIKEITHEIRHSSKRNPEK
jgi:hypothetical protein